MDNLGEDTRNLGAVADDVIEEQQVKTTLLLRGFFQVILHNCSTVMVKLFIYWVEGFRGADYQHRGGLGGLGLTTQAAERSQAGIRSGARRTVWCCHSPQELAGGPRR